LKTEAADPTANTSDIANYDAEFKALQTQLTSLTSATFNGVSLFVSGGSTLAVSTSADGSLTQNITQSDLAGKTSAITGAADLAAITGTQITQAVTDIAAQRAQNGSEASSLNFAAQFLSVDSTNLQSADSLIQDTDVASESTELAKDNILVQAGESMLSQANSSAENVLKLLQ
jgi:flagellin